MLQAHAKEACYKPVLQGRATGPCYRVVLQPVLQPYFSTVLHGRAAELCYSLMLQHRTASVCHEAVLQFVLQACARRPYFSVVLQTACTTKLFRSQI